MNWEHSCGAVVFTRENGELRFVLARERNGCYSFPKGHVEPGETERETALREIWEEVQLRPQILEGFREETEYALREKAHTRKRVTFFLAEYENQQIVPLQAELLEARLASFEEALRLFRHEDNRRVLRRAMEFIENRK